LDDRDQRLAKLIQRLDELIEELGEQRHDLPINNHISQFYYMQKREELKNLNEKLIEAMERLKFFEDSLDFKYKEVFQSWHKDVRWMNTYLLAKTKSQEPKDE
jgi:hypothetical protein